MFLCGLFKLFRLYIHYVLQSLINFVHLNFRLFAQWIHNIIANLISSDVCSEAERKRISIKRWKKFNTSKVTIPLPVQYGHCFDVYVYKTVQTIFE